MWIKFCKMLKVIHIVRKYLGNRKPERPWEMQTFSITQEPKAHTETY